MAGFFHSVFYALLLLFAALALAAHLASCLLGAGRRFWRAPKGQSAEQEGISAIMALRGGAEQSEPCLRAAFALHYAPKELIFCRSGAEDSAAAARLRQIREQNAAASLVIRAESEQACLVRAWQAARYEQVALLAQNSALPPLCLERLAARRRGKNSKDALICAVAWRAGARGMAALLSAAFQNGQRARMMFLAERLGAAVAQSGAQLWPYGLMSDAGGIKAFAAAAEAEGVAAAATQAARAGGRRILLAALPLAEPCAASEAGRMGAGAMLRRQIGDLRFERRFLPRLFYAEWLFCGFLPALALLLLWRGGSIGWGAAAGYGALWYGAQAAFMALAGGRTESGKAIVKQAACLPLCDMLMPALWLLSLRSARN